MDIFPSLVSGGAGNVSVGKFIDDAGLRVPGEYRIWAQNYSNTPGYSGSGARVTVTRDGQQLGVYDVATASGDSMLGLWRAVNLTIDASGNVTLTPVQQFASGGSSSVLRLDDGPAGDVTWPAGGKP